MVGVITTWDILVNPIATIRCFGWLVFFKAAVPWRDMPFLSLVEDAASLKPPPSSVPTILERCIALEVRAKRIYSILAKALDDQGLVGPFFAGLAEQEQYHADLLGVAKAAAIRKGWRANLFNPWQDYLPRLEQQMETAEKAIRDIDSIDAALQLVLQIESSEVNRVFDAALAASDAAFVRKLKPFRRAMEAHMSYIVERLPQLSPKLMLACRELRAKFPQARTESR
ncbi:MAG: ferritin family protein [Thermoguttaceae bacterium]